MKRTLLLPSALKKGDTVGVASVSGPVNRIALKRGISVITEMGFKVKLSSNIFLSHGYHSGTDEERVTGLNEFLADPEVRAVFFSRGGCGAFRILDLIDYDVLKRDPIVFMGYSDLTFLFSAFLSKLALPVFYGPVVQEFGKISENCFDGIKNLLYGRAQQPFLFGEDAIVSGTSVKAISAGGCLALLSALTGTEYEQDFDNSVLFWEDVDEPEYRIDRYLTHLKQSGKLKNVKAMVIGKMVLNRSDNKGFSMDRVIEEVCGNMDITFIRGLNFGHKGFSAIIPLGFETFVDCDLKEIVFSCKLQNG